MSVYLRKFGILIGSELVCFGRLDERFKTAPQFPLLPAPAGLLTSPARSRTDFNSDRPQFNSVRRGSPQQSNDMH